MVEREWVLLNPGPANTSLSVKQALVTPDLCHREPEFFEVMRECRERLVRVVGCRDTFATVLFTGSGTAAVEAMISSVVPPDRSVLVVSNGAYGERMVKIARAHGIPAEVLAYAITTPVPPADVERALRAHPEVSHVALCHHETTSGLLNPVMDVAQVAARAGRRVLVDAMSSLFGEPLDVAADGIDFVAASANKCLQGIPGVSFVLGRRVALEALRGRAPRSVYLDLWNHYVTQEQDNTPFTPAVQVLHAMRQALIELEQEGLAPRIARYGESARVLREGMMALGFEVLVPAGARSRLLTTFRLLPGLGYDGLHDAMKRRGYIIYAGQGEIRTYAFRVSNMGTLTPVDMKGVVDAFAASLEELGVMTGSTPLAEAPRESIPRQSLHRPLTASGPDDAAPPEYRGRILRVRRERYRLPDGREASLDAVRYRNVATVVPLLDDGRVVLLRQFRPIVDATLWEVPAGTIEPGESPEACALRELGEEAGFRAGRIEPLGEALVDPGLTDERLFLFVARDLTPVPRALDADEYIDVHAVPLAQAYRMIDTGEIADAGTVIALLRLRWRGVEQE